MGGRTYPRKDPVSTEDSLITSLTKALSPRPRPIDRILKPVTLFARHKLAGAALLMIGTAVALVWANSRWQHSYHHLLELDVGLHLGGHTFAKSLHHWVNDGLMGIFFFLVGLEIKREVLVGELSSLRKASLPAIAALGGILVPAAIFYALNQSGPAEAGWGIPMATDIAFALGVLALLGDRVPLGLKVFLTALAIVDDIGAVLVIAVFYTSELSLVALAVGFVCAGISVGLNLLGTRNPMTYLLVGVVAWLGFLESGVHATVAAILMAFTIPARTRIDGGDFLARVSLLVGRIERDVPQDTQMNSPAQQHLLGKMNETIGFASAPLQRIEHMLHGPVTFVVLPVFAFANAGVTLSGDIGASLGSQLVLGIVLGLFVGKTVGITSFAWLAVKLGFADLPTGVTWKQIVGVGALGGIGFTMALFIAELAFTDIAQIDAAKIGILAASMLSGGVGFLILASATKTKALGRKSPQS